MIFPNLTGRRARASNHAHGPRTVRLCLIFCLSFSQTWNPSKFLQRLSKRSVSFLPFHLASERISDLVLIRQWSFPARLFPVRLSDSLSHMLIRLMRDDDSFLPDCRDLMSCIGQILILNLLPAEFCHLPLLGLAVQQKHSATQSIETGASVSDLAM
jgi:hypothetical protein